MLIILNVKMEIEKKKAIIEAILFAAGREVKIEELMSVLEISSEDIISILHEMQLDYAENRRGIEIIRVNNSFQLATKKEFFEYLYPIFDKRSKPNLSNAALETLSIIAYNSKITRAEIEAIRGVNSDGTIYKLLEYNLIENVGKMDAPGRPTMYSTTNNFLKMFGLTTLDELPELPRYKVDENEQIIIEDLDTENINNKKEDTEIDVSKILEDIDEQLNNNEDSKGE